MKFTLIAALLLSYQLCFSQYIGVKARYTETRLVDDYPNPPKRENRLVLSFFEVNASGNYLPVNLSNYDIWIYKEGLQYGSYSGGVLDSSGNNYPGYTFTAPRAVAYFNSYNQNYIDCDPNLAEKFTVNGHELDCGFITVSYWEMDYGNGITFEAFTAPNICLPYYFPWEPYGYAPGNVNFSQPIAATPPYNSYSFSCGGSTQQVVIRGVLPAGDTNLIIPLPVRFDNVVGNITAAGTVTILWTNLTESDILHYEIEMSADGFNFQSLGKVLPHSNNGGKESYSFSFSGQGSGYYRIKAVEIQAAFFYSQIIHLKSTKGIEISESKLLVFPNPVVWGGSFRFQLRAADKGRYAYSLFNFNGQQLFYKFILHQGGDITRTVDLSGLPAGVYQLVVQTASEKFIQRLMYVH